MIDSYICEHNVYIWKVANLKANNAKRFDTYE